ncbi:B3 domain-containing transcription repressor VAL2 isoform X1 [Physcomitrium patens]|uniref:B3 domain-containing transcription repressor VAL2 isoform X1 n=2 Tax=Physcomitrium patens TaxID=3218 RepID=UPI000D15E815|nr:B3 domain-containing protein Os07g0679700-like isoform X1 [Physcomitrium patens]|eukprot:XP_024380835.1 B3 domain-containing protein Os07g0679700-like isoform X1 [Physcomitrella patens]
MAMGSTESRKVCWNSKCGTSSSTIWRPGWITRSGRTAELCDYCGLAYQQSCFCETFHSDDAGWRTCNFCKKRVHCGCVASAYGIVLLDKGGVECIRCATAHDSAGSISLVGKHGQQLLAPMTHLESGKVVDPAVRGWCEGFGAALAACQSDGGAWQPSSAARTSLSPPTGLIRPWSAPETDISMKSKDAADSVSREHMTLEVVEYGGEGTEIDRNPCSDRTKAGGAAGGSGSGSSQGPLRVARPPGEGRGRNQLLPRYWPRITDQELKQINSGDMQTTITPLFEKMLSASDAGRIGRLVLPKACAEAYFPPIHQPEGLPLRIQDVTGRDWVFQFRFWPNNNSRMYVLEGVTPCIQSMKLHAGDTVTFSRLEADGKLVMGYRKAPTSLSSQDAGATRVGANSNTGFSNPSSVVIQSADGWGSNVGGSKSKESGISIGNLWSSQMDRKRGRPLGSKSKRLRLDSIDSMLLKSNWEEAQELLRPAPSASSTVVTIDGHEFEEYSEPPVLSKRTFISNAPSGAQEQWAQCDDCGTWRRVPVDAFVPARWSCSQNTWDLTRAQCSAAQEVSSDKLEVLLGPGPTSEGGKQECAPKLTSTSKDENAPTTSAAAGLDALAQAASTSLSPARTTKHPRHRPGCTCIVCIQPPSGKGPKHKASCICNVCLTVKRRFRTLMQRRKKRQCEREFEAFRNKREWHEEDTSDLVGVVGRSGTADAANIVDDNLSTALIRSRDGGSEDGPLKGAIDLNIQPDHEERVSMVRLLQDATLPLSAYLHQQRLSTLYVGDLVSDHVSNDATSSQEDTPSESSSEAEADNGLEVAGHVRHEGQRTQTSLGYVEQPNCLESWDARGVKPAEFSGDSVLSSSSKLELNMMNNAAATSAKKHVTGAGRGRQICIGCGEQIGSAAKVCRRCGTCTAFGKKKRGVPL